MSMRGFVLAGTASGVGKTVATLAVCRALAERDQEVQPAKAGPDFIDPSHHTAVCGRPSRTLDVWLEGVEGSRRNYRRGRGEVCVVEGVMGLYDGAKSSTAMVAEALSLPVVLVVDASAGMESVAATALGFREYAAHVGREIDIAGVITQRAHGGRHERGIREALPDGLAYCGRIPPSEDLEIPDRHLGLRMGAKAVLADEALAEAGAHLDVDRLLELAREPPRPEPSPTDDADGGPEAVPETVAVARDEAFCFLYPAVLERLGERADVVPFSPVAGEDLPECDSVYLPGGYPELHAAELAASPALTTLAERAADGLPVLGECGGLMAMADSLRTVDGDAHRMAGILPADVRMHDRYQALDHTELRARGDALTARAGESLRGHEFHYSSCAVDPDARFAFDIERGSGIDGAHDGLTEYRALGTYCHVHAESAAFDRFLEAL